MIPFKMTRDINGYNGFGLPFADTAYSVTLTTNTNTTLAVPGQAAMGAATATTYNKYIAIFSYSPGATVWVCNNAIAVVPAGASFGATTSVLNPTAREVKFGDVINFITADTGDVVGVEFYALF